MRTAHPSRQIALGFILLWAGLLALCSIADATPPWGADEIARWELARPDETISANQPAITRAEALVRLAAAAERDQDYLLEFTRVAEFLSIWQNDIVGDPEFGGMREGEHLPDIIQTDNTSVWTRYYDLTGDNQYFQNIQDAFTYSLNWPAYLEENGSGETTGYYRMYNCGWAVRAEMIYRLVYDDDTYKAYGDSCGSYIRDHTLIRPGGTGFYQYVNPPVLSWALGNLYHAGHTQGRSDWTDAAVLKAETQVKVWVEGEPTLLSNETWAMSGGATMWGLISSYFQAHPGEAPVWLATYKDFMDTYSTSGSFTNAWNGWYALGHFATGDILANPTHLAYHVALTDTLLYEDGDDDGGVPARPEDTDEMDQTWVSNYLAFMGLSPLLPAFADVPSLDWEPDAGRLLQLSALPNPAVDRVIIHLQAPSILPATASVYDCQGRRVSRLPCGLLSGEGLAFSWDGRDDFGRMQPAGSYWAVVETPAATARKEIIWIR